MVNDDFPVERSGMVYGSPWSGKTNHCLLNDINARVTHVVSADNKEYDLLAIYRRI